MVQILQKAVWGNGTYAAIAQRFERGLDRLPRWLGGGQGGGDGAKFLLCNRTSVARTPLGPCKLVRDRGSSS